MLMDFFVNAAPFLARSYKGLYLWAKERYFGADAEAQAAPEGNSTALTPAKASEAVPPVPTAWARWNGARPELRGAPRDTILNFHGLSTTTPAFRAALLDVCERLGIPVDSMAYVLSHESDFNPKAKNPLPAAGIFQLTTGANLPGYLTKEAILGLLDKTAVEQLVPLEAMYERWHGKLHDVTPGTLLLANFLPKYLGKSEDTVMGSIPPELDVGFKPQALTDLHVARAASGQSFTPAEQIYIWNPGMDYNRDGMITVGDVYAAAAAQCAAPKGKRTHIDGSIWTPPAGAGNT